MLQVSPGKTYTHAGADPLTSPRVQFDCWGASLEAAGVIADAVIAAMEPPETVGSTRFVRSFVARRSDMPPLTLGDGTLAHCVSVDLFVWCQPVS